MDTCCLCTRPQGPFSANCETFDLLFAVDEVARFLFPVKQKQNEFNMQSDGALMKKHKHFQERCQRGTQGIWTLQQK